MWFVISKRERSIQTGINYDPQVGYIFMLLRGKYIYMILIKNRIRFNRANRHQ